MISLTITEWHQRYIQQAGWSAELRRLIYSYPWFTEAQYILELGCGTGAILQEILPFQKQCIIGLDIESEPLIFASSKNRPVDLVQADAFSIPFPKSSFDIAYCHYLLLWTQNPHQVITEMVRITKPGGWVLVLAEPDYGGRIDFPVELEALGKIQIQSLFLQGANPYTGRTLRSLFTKSNFSNVICGIFGAQWTSIESLNTDQEMNMVQFDFDYLENSELSISMDQFNILKQTNFEAYQKNTRVLFVPTFYAFGKVEKR